MTCESNVVAIPSSIFLENERLIFPNHPVLIEEPSAVYVPMPAIRTRSQQHLSSFMSKVKEMATYVDNSASDEERSD